MSGLGAWGIGLSFCAFTLLGVANSLDDVGYLVTSGFQEHALRVVSADLIFPIGPTLLITIFYFTYLRRLLEQQQQLMFAARYYQGEGAPLVQPQPVPNDSSVAFPIVIRMRARWQGVFARIGFFSSIAFALFIIRAFVNGDPMLIVVTAFVGGFVGLIMFIALSASLIAGQNSYIRATEDSLSYRNRFGVAHTISWDEAQLFSLTGFSRRTTDTFIYQLSASPGRGMAWSYRAQPHWWSVSAPTTSQEVYQQQMEALLSVIAARTGLPLYDLR